MRVERALLVATVAVLLWLLLSERPNNLLSPRLQGTRAPACTCLRTHASPTRTCTRTCTRTITRVHTHTHTRKRHKHKHTSQPAWRTKGQYHIYSNNNEHHAIFYVDRRVKEKSTQPSKTLLLLHGFPSARCCESYLCLVFSPLTFSSSPLLLFFSSSLLSPSLLIPSYFPLPPPSLLTRSSFSFDWSELIEPLSQSFDRIVAPDFLGFGFSYVV